MKNWNHLIREAHLLDHQGEGYQLVTGPPASPEAIADLQKELGFTFPGEFLELYKTANGVGITMDQGEIEWQFAPIAQIPGLVSDARGWFEETHAAMARRFFPFISYGSGDYSGYLISESGEILPGLWDFEHEAYEFDEDQPASEFMESVYESVEEFLAG